MGEMWEANAENWTLLARMGCDIYRDQFNTPAFMSMLPDVKGLSGLDIGCGEGSNTRQVASRGAKMTAVDIAPTFIRYALEKEREDPLGIVYSVADGTELPFPDYSFDFCTAFMSFMDMVDHEKAIKESYRVLRPGGFLQFSICHPCFNSSARRWIDDDEGGHIGLAVTDYFKEGQPIIEEWIFNETPADLKAKLPKFRILSYHRTLSSWMNLVLDAGYSIERVHEPTASDEAIRKYPHLADTRLISHFLILRCRKA